MADRSQTTEADAEKLISLLRRQVGIYTRLEQLSGRQRGLIVAAPRTGKTIKLQKLANAIAVI